MSQVTIRARATEVDAATAYRRISAFASFPRCTDAVRKVVVREVEPDSAGPDWTLSDWTLRFGAGLLCWTEQDRFDPEHRTITFSQVTGDFAVFDGTWTIEETAEHPVVCFDAEADLGIPAFAELLDPVVESTLREVIRHILVGVLGPIEELEPAVPSTS